MTDYYVDNTCANNGNGTTQTCGGAGGNGPFNSLANAQSGWTGDQSDNRLLFKKGQTFTGSITVGAYGTSGHPATISSYGTGAIPIISTSSNYGNIYVNNKSYVTIDGIETSGNTNGSGAGIYIENISIGCTVQNCVSHDNTYRGIMVIGSSGNNPNNSTIANNTIYNHLNGYGLTITGAYGTRTTGHQVYGNEFYYNSSGFYPVRMDDSYIHDNDIHDNSGTDEDYGIGVLSCSNNEFYNNLIYDNANKGLEIYGDVSPWGPASGNKIYNNWFYGHNDATGGGVSMGIDSSVSDNKIYNNIFTGNRHGCHITPYTGEQATGILIYGNIFYGNTKGIFAGTTDPGWIIKNNIFSENTTLDIDADSETGGTSTHSNNLFYRTGGGNSVAWNGTTYTDANITTWEDNSPNPTYQDPKFIGNSIWSDFRLQAGSPAIGAGATLDAAYDDALDPSDLTWPPSTIQQTVPWNIGAYKYGSIRTLFRL